MSRPRVLLGLIVLLASAPAAGQLDPDPDMCGIFFDEGAYVFCQDSVPPGGEVTAYLCLTRITATEGISFWEAKVEVSDGGTVTDWQVRGSAASNLATAPEFVVILGETLPWASSLVVLQMQVVVSTGYPVGLRVWPATNPSVPPAPFPLPVYATGGSPGEFHTLGYSFGWNPATGIPKWCAVINPAGSCSDDPMDTESVSWGGIKALYR